MPVVTRQNDQPARRLGGVQQMSQHMKVVEFPRQRNLVALGQQVIHGIHHDYPWDRDRLVMPPTVTALLAAAVWFGFRFLGAAEHAWMAGVVSGYVWYDLTHYYLHHAAPTTAFGKWLRRYHLVHHFQTPEVRYGITTPLWDYVFRTYPRDRYQGLPDDEKRLEAGA